VSTPFLLGSYITVEEYRAAPTALQTNNLVPGGLQAVQDAELASLISKASRKLDEWAWQPLYATAGSQNDEAVRVKDGDLILRAHQDRVKALTSLSWGVQWTTMTTLTNPPCFIEENHIRVQLSAGGTVWSGALNINNPTYGSVFASWSYVAGWATTRLTTACVSTATAITVDNPAGIVGAGSGVAPTILTLTDIDGATKTQVTVASVTGNVVTLTGQVGIGFSAGAGVAESEEIKPAAILAVSHYIKARKGSSVVMSKTPTTAAKDDIGDEMADAKEIAERFQRLTP
jgi:hypothetical protein